MLVLNFILSLMTSFKPFLVWVNDIVADTVLMELFENNQNICAEDEFSMGGEQIYFPPPLDKSWLSEPDPQDRRKKMQA